MSLYRYANGVLLARVNSAPVNTPTERGLPLVRLDLAVDKRGQNGGVSPYQVTFFGDLALATLTLKPETHVALPFRLKTRIIGEEHPKTVIDLAANGFSIFPGAETGCTLSTVGLVTNTPHANDDGDVKLLIEFDDPDYAARYGREPLPAVPVLFRGKASDAACAIKRGQAVFCQVLVRSKLKISERNDTEYYVVDLDGLSVAMIETREETPRRAEPPAESAPRHQEFGGGTTTTGDFDADDDDPFADA